MVTNSEGTGIAGFGGINKAHEERLKARITPAIVLFKPSCPCLKKPIKGIATHIFKKTDTTPLEVLVPLDAAQEPAMIKLEGLLVQASFEKLSIDCEKPDWASIEKARKYCCEAIDALPITPLSAAGFNLRYKLQDPEENFISSLVLSLDDKISEQGMSIEGREIRRSIEWQDGTINLQVVRIESNRYEILLNFDKQTADTVELKHWLSISIEEIKTVSTIFLCDILEACKKEEVECSTQQKQ